MSTILLIILILLLVGAIPSWSHSKNWGYGPSGGIGLIVVIVMSAVSTNSYRVALGTLRHGRASRY